VGDGLFDGAEDRPTNVDVGERVAASNPAQQDASAPNKRGYNLKPPTRQRIGGFDGLRALAVIAVFFSHKTPNWAGSSGFFGVTLFFALSGFLIIGILYQERLAIEAKRKSVGTACRAFLVRRSLRIFPIYYLTLALLAFLVLSDISRIDWDPIGHIFHIFYLSNVWIGSIQGKFIGQYSHLWSLSIEEQFYLIASPLLLFSPARMYLTICATAVGVGLIAHGAMLSNGSNGITIGTNSFINFLPIALGGVAVLACKQNRWRPGGDVLLSLAAGSFAMTWAALSIAHGWLVTALTLTIPVLAVLIVTLVYMSQEGFIVRALEWKPLAHLGRISYGFYLYHNFLGFSFFEHSDVSNRVLAILLDFLVVLIVAEISWHLIERPLIAFARARADIRPTKPYHNSSVFGEPSLREQRTRIPGIATSASD
jgi:peptidoglycan/LPS O-acetylase OafA/YrhL